MANTPPSLPMRERSTESLLDALCVELRHVGVGDINLPSDKRIVGHIEQVCTIHKELLTRQVDSTSRLEELGKQTGWLMKALLDDCLAFPSKLPYVREHDGIRRTLRCGQCKRAERPPDAKLFWVCNDCLEASIESIRTRQPRPGLILFRTFNPECRCEHADSDTVLAADCYIEQLSGVCDMCVEIELKRRRANPPVGL
jgi:hypothetical protein